MCSIKWNVTKTNSCVHSNVTGKQISLYLVMFLESIKHTKTNENLVHYKRNLFHAQSTMTVTSGQKKGNTKNVSQFGLVVRLVRRGTSVQISFGSPFSSKVVVCGHCLVTLSLTINETLKWLSSLPILMQESFWWWQCSDRYIISLFPHLHTPHPPPSPCP